MNPTDRALDGPAMVHDSGDAAALSALMANTLGDLIDAIAATERIIASATAARAELIEQSRRWSEVSQNALSTREPGGGPGCDAATAARRVLVTEIACALRLPERSVETLIADSQTLLNDLPATLASLRGGEISYRHAKTLIDHACSLPAGTRAAFEEALLPAAKTVTAAKLDRAARTVRERTHPETIAARHRAAVQDRSVQLQPARDGMAWLTAYLPAGDAHGIHNRLTDTAHRLRNEPDETRTLGQLRADILSDLLLDGDTTNTIGLGIRPTVHLTVPVMTLLGHGTEPATLEGYGPIDPDTAKRLAAGAPGFTRILTHPETGAVLSVGRARYAVPADLKRWLRVRDETCRFPGCNRSAAHADLDHTHDWQHGGVTAHDNLAHLCRTHHRLKHQTRWSVHHTSGGVLTWTSPTGHRYTTPPATRVTARTLSPPKPQRAEPPPPF